MTDNPDSPNALDAVVAAREEYTRGGLVESDLLPDPIAMFRRWYDEAHAAGLHEPNAMVVATVSADFAPSARLVLLKGVSEAGFVFYTNTGSRKGTELAGNPRIALLFPWHPLERQVRVDGTVTVLPRAEVDAYFAVRPRGSQLGAWASHQSSVVSGREELPRGVRRRGAALRRRGRADAHRVGRLPRAPGVGGVLAGPAGPDARPAGLPAYAGRLAHGAARTVAVKWPTVTMRDGRVAT